MFKSSWKYIVTLGLSVTLLCGLVILALFVLIHQRQSAYDQSIVVNQARELDGLSRIASLSREDFTRLIEQRPGHAGAFDPQNPRGSVRKLLR